MDPLEKSKILEELTVTYSNRRDMYKMFYKSIDYNDGGRYWLEKYKRMAVLVEALMAYNLPKSVAQCSERGEQHD